MKCRLLTVSYIMHPNVAIIYIDKTGLDFKGIILSTVNVLPNEEIYYSILYITVETLDFRAKTSKRN